MGLPVVTPDQPSAAPSSNLGSAVTQPQDPTQNYADSPDMGLQRVLPAVANTLTTGLSGIPQQGTSFVCYGLGQGAPEQAAQATQQAIRFVSFDDQLRAAQLTNEERRMQWADEDHQAAVQANADAQAKRMTASTGMTYTFVPNDDGGKAVLEHMCAQMAQNGQVSVPSGVIAGPKGWYIPNQGFGE